MLALDSTPFVSIIIPTYNRSRMIGITLESFINQTYPSDRFEIIVCDNNSTDDTAAVISEIAETATIPVKYIFEKRQGVHYARNTAFKHSKGEILYYTDDDMIADENLLAEILRPFDYDPLVASVTGRVMPKWEVEPPRWILNYCFNGWLSLQNRPEVLIISPIDCGVFSCHQAIKRAAFEQSGGFNPENTAGEWIGDGETGLNIKLKDLGYRFAYIRSSLIYHMIPPARTTQAYLNKRMANQGSCDSYTSYKANLYTSTQLFRRLISHGANIALQSAVCVLKVALGKGSWRLNRARVNYYINRVAYDFRLIHDKSWRGLVVKNDWLHDE